jgi:hypothetical protein
MCGSVPSLCRGPGTRLLYSETFFSVIKVFSVFFLGMALKFFLSLALTMQTIYGSEEWTTALDWVEVVFADFDFASDVLFCLEAYRVFSQCNPHLPSGGSPPYSYLSRSCPVVQEFFPRTTH